MKTLHVSPILQREAGGTTYALINILKIERLLGFQPEVVTLRRNSDDDPLEGLAQIHSFDSSFPSRVSRSVQANGWLRRNARNFDIVTIHGVWGAMQMEATHILHKAKVPFLIYPHGSLDPFDLQKRHLA